MSHIQHIQAIKALIKVMFQNRRSSLYILFFPADQLTEGPSVDSNVLNSDGSTKALDPKKSTIGQRRAPQAKKVCVNSLIFFFE